MAELSFEEAADLCPNTADELKDFAVTHGLSVTQCVALSNVGLLSWPSPST